MESMTPSNQTLSEVLDGAVAYVPVNVKTNMSSLRPSPVLDSAFKFPLKTPPNHIPIRFQDQKRILEDLDKLYYATKHPLLDTKHMFGRGHALTPDINDQEPSTDEAREILEQHINDREPYVMLAHNRLQNVMGLANHRVFDLPYNITPNPTPSTTFGRSSTGNMKRKDSAVILAGSRFNFDGGIQVDPVTGNGLREWLLGMGKANGSQRKQECKSISFHDFTPDKDDNFSNVLIGHFTAGDIGRRVDVYEVELPTIILDRTTGQERQVSEQWLWFLISKPLITLSSGGRSATQAFPELETSCSNYDTSGQYPDLDPSSLLQDAKRVEAAQLKPPPNFPHPIPSSWVVFACPGTNITAYPSTTESYPSSPSKLPVKPQYAFLGRAPGVRSGNKVHKRKDYDFSHQGVPIFEFSSGKERFFMPSNHAPPRFLSVDDIEPFHPGDSYNVRDRVAFSAADHTNLERIRSASLEEREKERMRGRYRVKEVPGKFSGQWWDSFVDKAYEDAGKWEWIKKAMVGGKCRVVVRWAEWEGDPEVQQNPNLLIESSDVKDEDRGIGLGLLLGEDKDSMRKKRKVSKGGKGLPMAGENLINHSRRRTAMSGFGVTGRVGAVNVMTAQEKTLSEQNRGNNYADR